MISVVAAHVGVDVESPTAAREWTLEWCSTGMCVDVYPEATGSVEAFIAHCTNVLFVFLGKAFIVIFTGQGTGLVTWRLRVWE